MTTHTDQLGISSLLKFHRKHGGGGYYALSYDAALNEWAPSGRYLVTSDDTGWHVSYVDSGTQVTVRGGVSGALVRPVGTTTTYRAAKELAQDDYNRLLSREGQE